MVVYHHMLSNTLDTSVVLNQTSLIHTLLKPTLVSTGLKFQLLIADTEATTLLKETKMNLLRDFTMLVPFQFHSKLLPASRTMQEVFTQLQIAEKPLKMLTTQSWLQDMVLRRELNIGISRTLGVHHGVLKVTSKWKEELTCALLLNATHILLLTGSEISNQESLKNDSNEPIDLLKI